VATVVRDAVVVVVSQHVQHVAQFGLVVMGIEAGAGSGRSSHWVS
jgi:hypothetical protein